MILQKKEIENLIPHRDPFLFVDTCEIITPGEHGKSEKLFTANEYFFKGHFPKMPIVPGVILIEGLAQTAGIVVSKGFENNLNKTVLFMSVTSAKFRKPVSPNDLISFNVNYINNVRSVYKFFGEAKKDETKVCEAIFSAMIIEKDSKEIL